MCIRDRPRTAQKVEDFRAILPQETRVYIAHIEGTPIEDMVATAARLAKEGFAVMPHFPARIIKDKATLEAQRLALEEQLNALAAACDAEQAGTS